ncbi:MAG: tetratricopeptide repeat protein, partial [Prevotellaceae bacterium]|nr:tetratricopeptide repeat protein [Prevotellaceae bacterium]
RILKAQNEKHLGKQPRWSRNKLAAMRKKSEIDPNKYDQIVVEDETSGEHEYKSEYRGKVQNRRVESQYQPYMALSLFEYSNAMTNYHPFVVEVDVVNKLLSGLKLTVSTLSTHLSNEEIKRQFAVADTLSNMLSANTQQPSAATYLARSVAYCIGQNYGDALKDVDIYLQQNPNSALGWWQRAVCNARMADYENGADPQTAQLRFKSVNADFEKAESLDNDNAYILYSHGTFLAHQQNYDKAIVYFTRAIELDSRFAEAYFNRGMVYLYKGDKVKGTADLSKAGELGLYSAYSIIKTNNKK